MTDAEAAVYRRKMRKFYQNARYRARKKAEKEAQNAQNSN